MCLFKQTQISRKFSSSGENKYSKLQQKIAYNNDVDISTIYQKSNKNKFKLNDNEENITDYNEKTISDIDGLERDLATSYIFMKELDLIKTATYKILPIKRVNFTLDNDNKLSIN